ncbi:MAG: hypothetical protein HQK66_03435 [Desulfamplus sp.]|nr:hypothetical protein [Desulfamplus sp.]
MLLNFFQEIKDLYRETDRKFQETDRKFQETDRLIKEQSNATRKLEKLFTSQWGKLIESLVEGLFVIRATGNSAEIVNMPDFMPRAW